MMDILKGTQFICSSRHSEFCSSFKQTLRPVTLQHVVVLYSLPFKFVLVACNEGHYKKYFMETSVVFKGEWHGRKSLFIRKNFLLKQLVAGVVFIYGHNDF